MALTNSQYDSIRRDYDKRQFRSHHEMTDHIEELYRKDPEIKKIDQSIAAISIRHAQRLLDGDHQALLELKDSLNQLTTQKKNLIQSLGYDLDYIEPHYQCPDCKDRGYINGKKCHCFAQAGIDLVYTQSNLKHVLAKENFDTFDLGIFSNDVVDPSTGKTSYETMKDARQKCLDYVAHFQDKDAPFYNLLFTGSTGVGKTFLSNCVAREILNMGYSVIYFSATGLFDVFHHNAYNKSPETQDSYQSIFDCDLLIIDDLGTEVTNNYTSSQLFTCVNERILRHNATIISTNLNLGELSERYSERTFSRIMKNYDLIKLVGNDLRFMN